MDVQKLYETLTGEPHPDADRRSALEGAVQTVREAMPKSDWSLARRLVWFAVYVAVFAVLAFLILPRR